jgi:hypothetical protein
MGEAMNRVSVVAVTLASAAAHHRTITRVTTAVERASLAAGQSTIPGLSSATSPPSLTAAST